MQTESGSSFVALSRFKVANGMSRQVREAFVARPHLVDNADGFLRMEVLVPCEDADEFWLVTHWRDRESFKAWHHSHTYRDSHAGIPKGLKLVPAATEIRFFEKICD